MSDIIDLSGMCPRATSPIDLVRVELARVTAAYFAGAPTYDQMRVLEEKLFNLMRSVRPLAGTGWNTTPPDSPFFQDQ
jgi:hypothetical protein